MRFFAKIMGDHRYCCDKPEKNQPFITVGRGRSALCRGYVSTRSRLRQFVGAIPEVTEHGVPGLLFKNLTVLADIIQDAVGNPGAH